MRNRCFLCFVIVWSLCFNVHSQYVFRHFDIVDGLSDNQIRNFTITEDGRVAIRTVSILNIYNGATFEHFYHDRSKDYEWSFNRYQIFKEYHDIRGRMWMKAPGYLSLFNLENNQFIYDIPGELAQLGVNKKLKNLFIDESKNYWFITDDNDVLFYDVIEEKLLEIESGKSDFSAKYGVPYEIAQYKNINYIIYTSGFFRCWDSTSREFTVQNSYFLDKISNATDRIALVPTSNGNLWLMYNNAVCKYDRSENRWTEVATIKGASNFFTCMDLDKEGNVWVGTSWSGLRRIDGNTHTIESISGLRLSNGGILDNDIQCLYADDNGGIWVGTLWQGICYYNPSMYKFGLIQTIENETLITNESVRCLLEDNNGDILIGTTSFGLKRYNPLTGETKNAFPGILSDDLCLSLYRDKKDRLWVGTYLNGFYCIDGHHIKNYNRSRVNMELYPNQNISRAVFEDDEGRFWVSVANEGVGELNLETGTISMLKERHPRISFHKQDYNFCSINDSIFAVYGENGLYYYDKKNDKTYIPEIDDPDNPKFAGPKVRYYFIFKDSRGLEWLGTDQGIRVWDEARKEVYVIDVDDGLLNHSVSSIEEDSNGVYWVSTVAGITKIELRKTADSYEFSLVNFDEQDGLQSGKFYDRSSLRARNGNIYFGGHHGVNWFNPNKIQYNKSKNKPVFSAFYLFNTLIKNGVEYNGHILIEKPINNTSKIRLNYNQNFISFEFAGLNYVNPSHTFYKYKLENYDQDWRVTETTGLGAATYTGLHPGEYKFLVYTANNDKLWGDEPAEMLIVITPPFWKTIYAYLFYVFLFLLLSVLIFKYFEKHRLQKLEEQKIVEQNRQKEELDQMKFRFFTNISHEFRTPLTLIMTPLNTLIQETEGGLKDKLKAIYRNANDMLGLINQLLDFRKLEMSGEKLQLKQGDFIEYIKYVFSVFQETAQSRNINFIFESECSELYIGFDKSKMQRILNNLYSNALKYTPDGGLISTSIKLTEKYDRQFVSINIADSGCGIDEKEVDSIFDRFYQSSMEETASVGSGIGLHLVKEYVLLHEGDIFVDSKLGEGCSFTFLIPTDLVLVEATDVTSVELKPKHSEAQSTSNQKTLLIVEDNVEFRDFLEEQLSKHFNILKASNGIEGEKLAKEKEPDLIISDLMMPLLDGLGLCNRLKNDIQTSHIPFILLTARLSDEARIESYKAGADSYISKPFNFEVLLARIEMLFDQQEKRRELFNQTIDISPQEITITTLDEELVQNAINCIEKNIDNPKYSVELLSSDVGLSRVHLYRKLQSITGHTPIDFIRTIRLKRAAQYLRDSQFNISEIADLVGFNTLKYFNKHFKDEFGMTPTQYRMENSSLNK